MGCQGEGSAPSCSGGGCVTLAQCWVSQSSVTPQEGSIGASVSGLPMLTGLESPKMMVHMKKSSQSRQDPKLQGPDCLQTPRHPTPGGTLEADNRNHVLENCLNGAVEPSSPGGSVLTVWKPEVRPQQPRAPEDHRGIRATCRGDTLTVGVHATLGSRPPH